MVSKFAITSRKHVINILWYYGVCKGKASVLNQRRLTTTNSCKCTEFYKGTPSVDSYTSYQLVLKMSNYEGMLLISRKPHKVQHYLSVLIFATMLNI